MKRRDLITKGLAALGGIAGLFVAGRAAAHEAHKQSPGYLENTLQRWGNPVTRIWIDGEIVYSREVNEIAPADGGRTFEFIGRGRRTRIKWLS